MPDGVGCRFGAIGDSQFGEDAGDVVAYGAFAQMKHLSDLTIGAPFGDERQHTAFLLGKFGECNGLHLPSGFTYFGEHTLGDAWVQK